MARKLDLHPDRLFPADRPTRALLPVPARHDGVRCVDYGVLAWPVAEHCLADGEAAELAHEVTGGLVRRDHTIDNPAIATHAA